MKKHFSNIFVAGILLSAIFASCERDNGKKYPEYPEIMQMSSNKSDIVTIQLAGSEPATIDWGDGSTRVTKELSSYPNFTTFSHKYTATNERIIKISGNNVTYLDCSNNQLIDLDVSKNKELIFLRCYRNQIRSLDVRNNTALIELFCNDNRLMYLDVSKSTAIIYLNCSENNLSSLNVSINTALLSLSCSNNQLSDLDVSNNIILKILDCNMNRLPVLDVNSNTKLLHLYCGENRLSNLDVSNNTTLTKLTCNSNLLSEDALNTLFGTLHNNTVIQDMGGGGISTMKNIYIDDNPGTNRCNTNIALEKGWTIN